MTEDVKFQESPPTTEVYLNSQGNKALTNLTPSVWPVNGVVQMLNNILYDCTTNGVSGSSYVINFSPPNMTNLFSVWTVDYNLYRSLNWGGNSFGTITGHGDINLAGMQSLGWELHGTNAEPLFVRVANFDTLAWSNDYHLATNSTARNKGTTNGLPANIVAAITNSEGKVDLGCYQH